MSTLPAKLFILFVLLGVAALVVFYYLVSKSVDTAAVEPSALPGIMAGAGPWEADTAQLKNRLEMIGLPALAEEGVRLHTHQHLDIFINGAHYDLPSEIGIGERNSFISPIHTHEDDSIIHVESPVVKRFTLGQFFDVWGVLFTDSCLGGYCNNDNERLRVYANGQEIVENFRDIALERRQQIAITFGRKDQEPVTIPAEFDFPENY